MSHTVQYAQEILKQQQNLTLQLQQLWQKLNIQPNNLNDLTALEKLSYWQKIRHWKTNHKLRKNIEAYQQLPSQTGIAKNDSHWQCAVTRSKTAIFIGLEELSDIALGILLANTSRLNSKKLVTQSSLATNRIITSGIG